MAGRVVTHPESLVERVLETAKRVVTVDVFDTLLYRLCTPGTVVERACADLADRTGRYPGQVLLIRRRIVRGLRARSKSRGMDREWRLREALGLLLDRLGTETGPEAVAEEARRELALERMAVAPAPGMSGVLERLGQAGLAVHFVSDTYLSVEDVGWLLAAHGLGHHLAGGFVSSGPLLGKTTGRLFEHVSRELGVEPHEIVHFGNHPKSDLAMPNRMGVRSLWYLDRKHARHMAALAVAARRTDPDGRAAYRHLTRRTAPMIVNAKRTDEAMFELGRTVAAPVATHLALHVLERHVARPFRKILFVAREGLPFLAAARRMARALDLGIDRGTLQYAMISRAVTVLPAADPADPLASGLWTIGTKTRISTARDFLRQFLLPDELIDEFLPRVDPDLDVDEARDGEARAAISRLGRDPVFLEAVRREQQRQRSLLDAYLGSIGTLGPGRVAIVDVGWAGSTQDAIARLHPPPSGPELEGHYLGLTTRGEPPRPGSTKHGFLIDQRNEGPSRLGVQLTAGAVRVCEVLFRAHHGTTIGYERDGDRVVPLLGPSIHEELAHSPALLESLASVWAGFVEGLEDEARAIRLETVRPLSSPRLARAIMHRFLSYPTRQEAEALTRIPHVQDAGQGLVDSIGPAGLRKGTAWIPAVLSASGLRPLQPAFDLLCFGHEVVRVAREILR